MIRVHLNGAQPWADFPECDGWLVNSSHLLEVKRDGEVMAAFKPDGWAWVEDVRDDTTSTTSPDGS